MGSHSRRVSAQVVEAIKAAGGQPVVLAVAEEGQRGAAPASRAQGQHEEVHDQAHGFSPSARPPVPRDTAQPPTGAGPRMEERRDSCAA